MKVFEITIKEESDCEIDLDRCIWIAIPDGFTMVANAGCNEDLRIDETAYTEMVAGIDFVISAEAGHCDTCGAAPGEVHPMSCAEYGEQT